MRFMTWNMNSIRLRINLLLDLIKEEDPDVICIQETKTPDEFFPFGPLQDAGYGHIHIQGMKGYNGVAIMSKTPFDAKNQFDRVGRPDCRHISVTLPAANTNGPVEVHCLYIPAGGYEPDPVINDKFQHKLDFVDEMSGWFKDNYTPDQPLIALGDFNIAPLEHDVWSHKQLLNVVSHTPDEVTRLEKMQSSLNWTDCTRHFVPEDEKCYTWWSYRNKDWKKSNRGRRLDHIWVTPPLADGIKGQKIRTDVRDWTKTSDHVPVIADIDV